MKKLFLLFTLITISTISIATATKAENKALIGGNFTLTNQDNEKVQSSNFKGKPMLVFFGFTNCPAICPTGLLTLSNVLDELDKSGDSDKIAPIFITIDPKRDTSEQIKSFLKNFHKSIIGLTGTEEEITSVERSYKVYSAKEEKKEEKDGYTMNHSAYIYLMDREGEYFKHFSHDSSSEEILKTIKESF